MFSSGKNSEGSEQNLFFDLVVFNTRKENMVLFSKTQVSIKNKNKLPKTHEKEPEVTEALFHYFRTFVFCVSRKEHQTWCLKKRALGGLCCSKKRALGGLCCSKKRSSSRALLSKKQVKKPILFIRTPAYFVLLGALLLSSFFWKKKKTLKKNIKKNFCFIKRNTLKSYLFMNLPRN